MGKTRGDRQSYNDAFGRELERALKAAEEERRVREFVPWNTVVSKVGNHWVRGAWRTGTSVGYLFTLLKGEREQCLRDLKAAAKV